MAKATTGEEITENSVPILDGWGWDSYWDCSDWIEWHKITKSRKGKAYADSRFLQYWNQQTMGAHAIDCRSFNTAFRDYMRKENLLDALYSGIGVIAEPIGAGTDLIHSGTEATTNVGKIIDGATKFFKIALPIILIGVLVLASIWAYKKFAK